MFNGIRRAVLLARERHFPKGRHRRPSTHPRPVTVFARPEPTGRSAADRERYPNRAGLLVGEDVALVRPYVLAWERRARHRSVIVVPRLSAEAWSALVGGR
ncbi:hypothetical protein ADK41_09310 [Streptomyces caelestis]|uniref:Uncharacterized protein n=1 Tax=Streptomyces caelestis TaxID=36816 RepID=A0A0M8QLS7_9ACTN|nr:MULTISPECIES: hypothetical protein [Streptomyces]KOT42058.1 hypothetical protein ADK41_09310 [Streptomyces caelestis]